MEQILDCEIFRKLVHAKKRTIVYTNHAIAQARKRNIILDKEGMIPVFERDLSEKPYRVVECESENPKERKFKAYYQASGGGFMVYILVLNSQTRLISTYKTSKKLQQKMYDYEKSTVRRTKRK